MKRIALFIITLFVCVICRADTFTQYWYVEDNTPIQTSCTTGGDIILPTPPTKYGYDFIGWEKVPIQRIEYLESTGTQYIDTGVIANETTEAEIEFRDLVSSPPLFMATNGGWSSKNFGINGGSQNGRGYLLFYMNCDGWTNLEIPHSGGNIKLLLNGIYYNDTRLSITRGAIPSSQAFSTTYPLYLFADNDAGAAKYLSKFKLVYFKIWQNNILVRDFIPVLDGNGTPCMFDKVEGKYYYNAGTGDFIAGPVIGE